MNRNSADSYIPAEIKTSLDLPPLWGRLTALCADRAELLSHFEFPEGRTLALTFEFGGAAFPDVRARITAAARDADGYYNYELSFTDRAQSDLLRAAITRAAPPAV
ncbi:MAG: hypothetical protein ACYC2I_03825 [Elusimicrobiales bacterium]